MPGMRGPEVAERLAVDRPGTAVLFMSGYADGLMDDRGMLPPSITLLTKPFTAAQLLAAVRTAVGAGQAVDGAS